MLLAVPTLWETYLVLMVPITFIVVRRVTLGEDIPFRLLVFISLTLVSIGLVPGLPPALHASAAAQVVGFSLPMYGLVALVLVGLSSPRPSAHQERFEGSQIGRQGLV